MLGVGVGEGVLCVGVGVLLHLVGQVGGRAEAHHTDDRVVCVVCRICVCILYCIFNEFKRIFFGYVKRVSMHENLAQHAYLASEKNPVQKAVLGRLNGLATHPLRTGLERAVPRGSEGVRGGVRGPVRG